MAAEQEPYPLSKGMGIARETGSPVTVVDAVLGDKTPHVILFPER